MLCNWLQRVRLISTVMAGRKNTECRMRVPVLSLRFYCSGQINDPCSAAQMSSAVLFHAICCFSYATEMAALISWAMWW